MFELPSRESSKSLAARRNVCEVGNMTVESGRRADKQIDKCAWSEDVPQEVHAFGSIVYVFEMQSPS
jgi:hypothetical protein